MPFVLAQEAVLAIPNRLDVEDRFVCDLMMLDDRDQAELNRARRIVKRDHMRRKAQS